MKAARESERTGSHTSAASLLLQGSHDWVCSIPFINMMNGKSSHKKNQQHHFKPASDIWYVYRNVGIPWLIWIKKIWCDVSTEWQTHIERQTEANWIRYILIWQEHNEGKHRTKDIGYNAPMKPPCATPLPLYLCAISKYISHLSSWIVCPDKAGEALLLLLLLLLYLAIRSLRLFITNGATALYECPQAQHHTVLWYSCRNCFGV